MIDWSKGNRRMVRSMFSGEGSYPVPSAGPASARTRRPACPAAPACRRAWDRTRPAQRQRAAEGVADEGGLSISSASGCRPWRTHNLMSYLASSLNSVKPKPAISGTITRNDCASSFITPFQLVQPDTPGPEPCSRNRGLPRPVEVVGLVLGGQQRLAHALKLAHRFLHTHTYVYGMEAIGDGQGDILRITRC